MLRLTFVWIILIVGGACSLYSTFNTLLFYLWYGYFRPEDWVWSWSLWALGISKWIGILLVLRAIFVPETYRLSSRSLLLFLLLSHTFVSLVLSDYRADAWDSWTEFAKIIIVSHLVATLPSDARKFRMVLVVIAFSLGFEATKQGYAGLILNPGGKNYNAIRFLGEENGVAIGMLMLTPILGALAGTTTQQWERYIYRFMTVGVLYRGLVTYSRGGFVGCIALAWIHLLRSRQRLRTLFGILFVAGVILPAMPPAFWDRMNTITPNEEEMDPSSAGRMHFWRVALVMANDRPLLGVGHNAYTSAFDDYDFLDGAMGTGKAVHSVWFGSLADLGYPGFLLVAANLGFALLACRRVRKWAARHEVPEALGRYGAALESALWVAAISGTFSNFHYSEMLWHFVGLTIALEGIALKDRQALASEEVTEAQQAPEPERAAAAAFSPLPERV